jgi:hypothetical protein
VRARRPQPRPPPELPGPGADSPRAAVFLTVAGEASGRQVPFAFLEKVKVEFLEKFVQTGRTATAHSMDRSLGCALRRALVHAAPRREQAPPWSAWRRSHRAACRAQAAAAVLDGLVRQAPGGAQQGRRRAAQGARSAAQQTERTSARPHERAC